MSANKPTAERSEASNPKPPTPGAIPVEAIDEAEQAIKKAHFGAGWYAETLRDRILAKAALEAAAPAIREQERERILEVVDDERQGGGTFTDAKAVHNRAIDDCLAAIRSEVDDGE